MSAAGLERACPGPAAPLLALVADVGGPEYHLGDDAMLQANLDRLRGLVPAARLRVLGRADDELGEATALFLSGGGNLSSSWPDLLAQRIALIRAATRRGLPVASGGQTLGPALAEGWEGALADALAGVAHLGLRELPSLALARQLGVPDAALILQVDDAFLLAGSPPAAEMASVTASTLLITLDPSTTPAELRGLALQLARFCAEAGLSPAFLPHLGQLGRSDDGDGAVGRALATLLAGEGLDCPVLPLPQARQGVWLTQRAGCVLSTRYHPLVFATAAGVPCLGLHRDAYTRIKLQGALAQVGQADWSLPTTGCEDGGLLSVLRRLWQERAGIRQLSQAMRPAIEARESLRWQRILERLGLAKAPLRPGEPPALGLPPGELATAALEALGRERRTGDAEARRLQGTLETLGKSLQLGGPRSGVSAPPRPAETPRLTEADWADFARDGFLRLGQVLAPAELEALRQRADDLALGRVRNPQVQFQLDTGGDYDRLPGAVESLGSGTTLYRKIQGLENDELYARLLDHPLFREACARIYGAHAAISIFRAMVMNKPAGQGTLLPWHQDGGDVWALDRDPLLTAWVALDAATLANGCMEVVPGSHRLGLLTRQGSTLDEASAARHCRPELVRPLEVEAGHAVVFHNWLIHRSGVNPTAAPRRAFTACFMDGRTLSILTGNGFPLVAGEGAGEPYPFVRQVRSDSALLRASLDEATRYARSLEREVARLREKHAEAERYALSLAAERERYAEMERYALSLAAERETLRTQAAAPPMPQRAPSPRGMLRRLRGR